VDPAFQRFPQMCSLSAAFVNKKIFLATTQNVQNTVQ